MGSRGRFRLGSREYRTETESTSSAWEGCEGVYLRNRSRPR